MAKVTSKLQVTIPKALADRTGIRAGDEIDWSAAGDGLRVTPARAGTPLSTELKLDLFDRATARQRRRERTRKRMSTSASGRRWSRADLYNRGRSR